jgi:hypothetical protein
MQAMKETLHFEKNFLGKEQFSNQFPLNNIFLNFGGILFRSAKYSVH